MSKYEAVYFVGDNQAINRVRIDSSKTRNRGAFSGSLAALLLSKAIVTPKLLQLECLPKICCSATLSLAIRWYIAWGSIACHK